MDGKMMGAFVSRRRQKWAWSERLIERERIREFAMMICGPASNDKIAHAVQVLTAVCNAQHAKTIADGRARAAAKKTEAEGHVTHAIEDSFVRRRRLAEFLEGA